MNSVFEFYNISHDFVSFLKKYSTLMFLYYSMVSNCRVVWNNRGGYYIGLFGHYIKNHVLFNNFF